MQLTLTRQACVLVIRQLRDRWLLLERAEERLERAKARAYGIGAAQPDREPIRDANQRDRLSRRVSAVADAERRLDEARRWLAVFAEMDRLYPPAETCPEGQAAALLYGSGYTIAETARALGVRPLTVRRRRDAWVIEAAMMAARDGLLQEVAKHGGQ